MGIQRFTCKCTVVREITIKKNCSFLEPRVLWQNMTVHWQKHVLILSNFSSLRKCGRVIPTLKYLPAFLALLLVLVSLNLRISQAGLEKPWLRGSTKGLWLRAWKSSVYSFSRSCPKTESRARENFPTSSTLLRLQLWRTRDCAHRSRHVLFLFLFLFFWREMHLPKVSWKSNPAAPGLASQVWAFKSELDVICCFALNLSVKNSVLTKGI